MFTRLLLIALLSLMACESSPKTKPDLEETPKVAAIDVEALTKAVVVLRDREFSGATPKFVPVARLKPMAVAGHAAYVKDHQALSLALFGESVGPELSSFSDRDIARFDAKTNTIHYVASSDPKALDRALTFAVVDAIDTQQFAALRPAMSWDEELARAATEHAMASFVFVTRQAAAQGVDPKTVARRPEAMADLDAVAFEAAGQVAARESAFARREGFTLAAAMMRAGGWSSAEMLRIEPPKSAAYVVRPDRWLAGEDLGEWAWPDSVWEADTQGRVGPAIAALWLGQHIEPRVARSLYLSWQSDAYRFRGDAKSWDFEWVSLWTSPHDAEQVAQALDAGLRAAKHGSFVVVNSGATVAVVGSAQVKVSDKNTLIATRLAQITPRFTPRKRKLVAFVPTPFDAYGQGVLDSELVFDLQKQMWRDPASQLILTLEPLKGWKVQKTESPTARWVASRPDGASILMNTELKDPFLPAFDTDAYSNLLVSNFKKSMASPQVLAQETSQHQELGVVHHLRLAGSVDNLPTVVELWMFAVDDVLVTLSLKAWPDTVDSARPALIALLDAIRVTSGEPVPEERQGIIKFTVEN